MEWPKGLLDGANPGRCGMEPALKRDKSDALLAWSEKPPLIALVLGVLDPGLNGLVDGVGREVLETRTDWGFNAPSPAVGENLDGSVPARVRPRGPG